MVGSGKTTFDEEEEPTQIHELPIPVVPDEQCKERIGEPFDKVLLCMRKEGEMKWGCFGDSGKCATSVKCRIQHVCRIQKTLMCYLCISQ